MVCQKEQVIEKIRALPESTTVDDIMDELLFRIQIDHGLRELDEGKGIPHEEVKRRMSKWLSK